MVEEVQGELTDLQTLNLSCIADDAHGTAAHDALEHAPTIAWNRCPRSLECAAHSLNTRPCAVLGFQTPEEVFMAELSKLGDALQI